MPAGKRLKIAYVSSYNPLDKSVWSGTAYSIYNSLSKFVGDVEILGPYLPGLARFRGRLKSLLARLSGGKRYNYGHSFLMAGAYGDFFNKKLAEGNYDLIVAPAGACIVAGLKTNIPIVYITDSTVAVSLNYHDNLSNLSDESVKESLAVEQEALQKASLCVFSSQWAAQSAARDFNIPYDKVKIIPYGANFEKLPAANEVEYEKRGPMINLLFVGVYWESKGGERAYNCLLRLLESGYKARLTVCGCTPPPQFNHPAMEVVPFLNKNNEKDAARLSELFKAADFLLLPTRFDCTPIVICEASAYGIPTLCADTGGVRGHLLEGVNGFLISYNDMGAGYEAKIIELWKNPEMMRSLRHSSRRFYEENLNWNHWTTEFNKLITPLLKVPV